MRKKSKKKQEESSEKRAIIFGPWVGEFSYELNWWVPEARKIRNDRFPSARSVAVSFIGRRGMYKDFIDDYIEYPKFVQNTLMYPSMTFCIENNLHVIPKTAMKFFETVILSYENQGYKVQYALPGPTELKPDPERGGVPIPQKVFQDFPFGEYKHLEPEPKINTKVKNKLKKFSPKKDVVYVMASVRFRDGKLEKKSWPLERYEDLIIRMIEELGVNIVLAGPKGFGNYPGALSARKSKKLKKYKDNILDMVADEEIVDFQLAILKNTKCSFWNSTGACNLAFFTNTPMFTQHASWYGDRLKFGWQKELTNGHKNVKIFDKYSIDELYESPLDELFEEFRDFYLGLGKA